MDLFASDDTNKQHRKETLTVSELISEVKSNLENRYKTVKVIGEISSFRAWRSGHWYFDLKDENALLPAVMFKFSCNKVQFEVKDGMEVLLTGRISMYAPQSKVQIVASKMEPVGVGALALAFEQLKAKLEKEGLFDVSKKKDMPGFPTKIGLVTSPQGAAVRDMLKILKVRMPKAHVLISPVRVQGQGSAQEIAHGIQQLDQTQKCDVIIVGRGGGSLEDLWSFNEEVVARAIFASATPVVSAVGHETDFSIADFVADLRAATPTHAAQLVVPDLKDIVTSLTDFKKRLYQQTKARLSQNTLRLERTAKRIKEPKQILFQLMQRVDESAMRLERALLNKFKRSREHFLLLQRRVSSVQLAKKAVLEQNKIDHQKRRLENALQTKLKLTKERTNLLAAKLTALSPLSVLSRGYALVFKLDNQGNKQVISKAKLADKDDLLQIKMQDAELNVKVQ